MQEGYETWQVRLVAYMLPIQTDMLEFGTQITTEMKTEVMEGVR